MLTPLPRAASVAEYQRYVTEMMQERGFDRQTIHEQFMKFLEECGELAKAAKKRLKHPEDAERLQDLGHEAADVFIYLLTICNHFGVDLETAFREKEEINKGRRW